MKKLFLIAFLLIWIAPIYATEPELDILHYQNRKLALQIGWGHPSLLEAYYHQNRIDYPFDMSSTANYQRPVAFWKIKNEKLFLKEILIDDDKYQPSRFNIKSKDDTGSKDEVFAEWFSGIIESHLTNKKDYRKIEVRYYFQVRNGQIIDGQILTNSDLQRIENLAEKDQSDEKLMAKYFMYKLNANYLAYYNRLHSDESISLGNREGFLRCNSGFSPLLAYYSNDHLKWPYNWENAKISGAPNCKWVIDHQKLYLTEINLHSGLKLDSIATTKIELSSIFIDKVRNNRVFADWISGVYLIQYGKVVADQEHPGEKSFKVNENSFIRISKGIIVERYTILGDFDLKNIPENYEPEMKKIIEDYKR